MNLYHVTYYYLATGMEGHADTKDYGDIAADTSEEACERIAILEYPNNKEERNFLIGCLTATLVNQNDFYAKPIYQSGQIIPDKKINKPKYCCLHQNLIPLEIGFASKTYPNGYQAEPNYNFAINLIGANITRVKTYLCLDCKMEIKAPDPGQLKMDRL